MSDNPRERITATSSDDWECICGNRPDLDGFYPYHDGHEVEPTEGGPWDGVRFVCAQCCRVIDQNTLDVVEHPDEVQWRDDMGRACRCPEPLYVPYESDGALGHGWECGRCGAFLQAG